MMPLKKFRIWGLSCLCRNCMNCGQVFVVKQITYTHFKHGYPPWANMVTSPNAVPIPQVFHRSSRWKRLGTTNNLFLSANWIWRRLSTLCQNHLFCCCAGKDSGCHLPLHKGWSILLGIRLCRHLLHQKNSIRWAFWDISPWRSTLSGTRERSQPICLARSHLYMLKNMSVPEQHFLLCKPNGWRIRRC